jgi:hypothetical protein
MYDVERSTDVVVCGSADGIHSILSYLAGTNVCERLCDNDANAEPRVPVQSMQSEFQTIEPRPCDGMICINAVEINA